jgi:acyl-CoA thioesterase-1
MPIALKKPIIVMMMGYLCSCSNPSNQLEETEAPHREETKVQSLPKSSVQRNTLSKGEMDTQLTSTESQSSMKNHQTLLIIGDSLSAAFGIAPQLGWVFLLEQRLLNKGYHYHVINASISGDTTSGGLRRLLKQQYPADITILELGANDGLRGLSLKQMRKNLATMIEHSQQAGAKVLLLGMRIPPNYGQLYTDRFHQIYQELAAEYDTSLVPFFLEGVGGHRDLMQDDGLHPTASAQQRLLENVWQVLEEMLIE